MTLAEALASAELTDGKYGYVVNGKRVTVEVAPASHIAPSARYDESDVMLDPWCELPLQGIPILNPRFEPGPLSIDIPDMPQDDE